VIAVCDEDAVLDVPELFANKAELQGKATALADTTSRHKYDFPSSGVPLSQYRGELNGKELRLAGRFHLGVDLPPTAIC